MKKGKIHHPVGDQLRAKERQKGGPDSASPTIMDPRDAAALANIPQSQLIESDGDGEAGTNDEDNS